MRILFISSSSGSRGGGELCLVYMAKEMKKQGHDVGLWTSTHEKMNELCEQFSEHGEIIRANYLNTYDRRFRSLSHLDSLGRTDTSIIESWHSFSPDILHINKQNLEDGLDLLDLADKQKIPHIAFLHITQSASYLKAKNAFVRDYVSRLFLNRYSGPIVTTKNRIPQLTDFLSNNDSLVGIDNGVSLPSQTEYTNFRNDCRKSLGIDENTFLVLGIGRLEEQKRPHLFRAFAEKILSEKSHVKILWVGAGRLENEWAEDITNSDHTSQYQLIGWQNDVNPYYAASDLYIHSAGFEGMPYSLLEAMACQAPSMVLEDLANELPYMNEDNCFISNETADNWPSNIYNSEILKEKSAAGRKTVEDKYSIRLMCENYIQLYQQTISSSHS